MTVTILAGELRTGRVLATVPVSSASWSMLHRDAGKVDATVPLRAVEVARRPELLSALDPTRCYLAAVTDTGAVLEAGPIWKHTWDAKTGRLGVNAAGLWSLWDHRRAIPPIPPGQRVQDMRLDYTGLDLGSIAMRLVQTMTLHAGGDLPLILEPARAGTRERHYFGFELASTGQRLKQLMDVDNGPDITFEPRLSADRQRVEWLMRTGTEAQPMLSQSGADWTWDTRPRRSPTMELSVSRDATRLASRQWAVGSGTDDEKLIRPAEDTSLVGLGYPLLEEDSTYSSVLDVATLDAHAAGDLRGNARPWATWKSTVSASAKPTLGDYRPGDWARIYIDPTDPYLGQVAPAGWVRTRITGVSGNLDDAVDLTIQPVMEAR